MVLLDSPGRSSIPRAKESLDISISLMASLTSSFSTVLKVLKQAIAVANLDFFEKQKDWNRSAWMDLSQSLDHFTRSGIKIIMNNSSISTASCETNNLFLLSDLFWLKLRSIRTFHGSYSLFYWLNWINKTISNKNKVGIK